MDLAPHWCCWLSATVWLNHGPGSALVLLVALSPQLKGCDCLAKPWTWLRIGAAGFAQPTVEGMRLFG